MSKFTKLFKVCQIIGARKNDLFKRCLAQGCDDCGTSIFNNPMDICCKNVLITGGEKGVGYCLAQHALLEGAYRVGLVGIDCCAGNSAVNALNSVFGHNRVIFFRCDLSKIDEIDVAFVNIFKEFEYIDIIVNAAGIFNQKEFQEEMSVNYGSVLEMTMRFYRLLSKKRKEGRGGVILNYASVSGLTHSYPHPTLAGAFHGVVGLSRSLGHGKLFSTSGVRVICLCPGLTETCFFCNYEKKLIDADMVKYNKKLLCKAPWQKPDICARAGIYLLKRAASGTVWVVENSKLYSLKFPNWPSFAKLESNIC